MANYIDKDALVAEINNGINGRNDWHLDEYRKGYHDALVTLKNYLSTLEEVDFEKELDRIWFDNKFGDYFNNDAVDFARIRTICKHFFELGLKAQKGDK